MHPVVTASLVSLGKGVVENLTRSVGKQFNSPSNLSFLSEINHAEKNTSVSSTGIQLGSLSEIQLKESLLRDPVVVSFAEANPNTRIFLQRRSDGTMQVGSSSGQLLVLEKDSAVNQIASAFFDKSRVQGSSQSPLHPETVFLK